MIIICLRIHPTSIISIAIAISIIWLPCAQEILPACTLSVSMIKRTRSTSCSFSFWWRLCDRETNNNCNNCYQSKNQQHKSSKICWCAVSFEAPCFELVCPGNACTIRFVVAFFLFLSMTFLEGSHYYRFRICDIPFLCFHRLINVNIVDHNFLRFFSWYCESGRILSDDISINKNTPTRGVCSGKEMCCNIFCLVKVFITLEKLQKKATRVLIFICLPILHGRLASAT